MKYVDRQKVILCFVDRASRYVCNNWMHYLSSVYSVTIPLHVSCLLVAHHQEVTMYICNNWYVLFFLVDCLRAWFEFHSNLLKMEKLQARNMYEVIYKIYGTGAAIYTEVVVARSTGPNRPNCEFRVLLRSFAETAWKVEKTSPRTLAKTDLAASQCHHDNVPSYTTVLNQQFLAKQNMAVNPYPPYTRDLSSCDFLFFSKSETKSERTPVRYHCEDPGRNAECTCHCDRKGLTASVQKWRRRWSRCLHEGGNYFEGDGGR
jgi:hypothetical protein